MPGAGGCRVTCAWQRWVEQEVERAVLAVPRYLRVAAMSTEKVSPVVSSSKDSM